MAYFGSRPVDWKQVDVTPQLLVLVCYTAHGEIWPMQLELG